MKKIKRPIALFLCFLMLISSPIYAFAQTEQIEETETKSVIPECSGAPTCWGTNNGDPIQNHADGCARKDYLKNYVLSKTAEEIAADWKNFTESEQTDILLMVQTYNASIYEELKALVDNAQPENPCDCGCENCTGEEGCECQCANCDFCEKEEPPVGDMGLTVQGVPENVTVDVETAAPNAWNEDVFEVVCGRKVVFAMDIALTEEGTEWQPNEGESVTVTLDAESLGLSEGQQIGILHEHNGELNDLGIHTVADGKLSFETNGFSVFYGYTVDFEYDGVWYSIAGGSEVSLAWLFERLYIEESVEDVADVQFSNNALIEVRSENGTWYLKSLQAFTSEEKLTITLKNGSVLVINVYDATISDLNGQLTDATKLTDITSGSYGDLPVLVNQPVSYEYSDVIIGLPAGQVSYEISMPDGVGVTQETSKYAPNQWEASGLQCAVRGNDTAAVSATAANKQKIQQGYSVIYKNIQTTMNQRVDLKVSILDYQVGVYNHNEHRSYPVIGLRLTGFEDDSNALPGVMIRGVDWVTLKYEFLDESGDPIELKGNTTYYDVDYAQGVVLHDNCDGVYITKSNIANDNCQLYISDVTGLDNMPNGYAVFERDNLGTEGSPMIGSYGFSETFEGSTLTRTFVIRGAGAIYHNGTPAIRETGNISLKKEVVGEVNPDGYDFTITFEDSTINTEHDARLQTDGGLTDKKVTFTNGTAQVKLNAGETITIKDVPASMLFTITEHNTKDYVVFADGKPLIKRSAGNDEYVVSEHITLRDQTTNVVFKNQSVSIPVVPDQGLVINKQAEFNNTTGTGKITLEAYVKGQVTSANTDVVLLIDQSASMFSAVKQGEGGYVVTSANKDDATGKSLSEVLNSESAKYAGYYACYERDGDNKHAYLIRYHNGEWQRSATAGYHQSNNVGWDSNGFVGQIGCIFDMNSWTAIGNPNHYYYFKTISGALHDALNAFAGEMKDAVNCRVAVATFAGDPTQTDPAFNGSGIFINGEFVKHKDYSEEELKTAFMNPTESNLNVVLDKIETIYSYTPTGLGLHYVTKLFEQGGREDANKIAIVFTDGTPSDGSDYNNQGYRTYAEQLKTVANEVYCVGPQTGTQTPDFMQVIASDANHAIVAGSDSLNAVFKGIAGIIVSATKTANSSSIIRDILSSSFKLPKNTTAANINVYTEKYTGNDISGVPQFDMYNRVKWTPDPNKPDEEYIRVNTTTDTVEVKGYKFEENYIIPGTPGGYKLTIEIPFVPINGFLGGMNIETNDVNSGVVVEESLIPFEKPTVSVDLKLPLPKVANDVIYVSQKTDLMELVEETKYSIGEGADLWSVDGDVNEFVTIEYTITDPDTQKYLTFTIPAGTSDLSDISLDKSGGLDPEQALEADKTYHVISKVTSAGQSISNAEQPQAVTVKVFKPVITFQDSVLNAGATANYAEENLASVVWENEDKTPTPDEQNKLGTAPVLTYTYTPEASAFTQETEVQVTEVKTGNMVIDLKNVTFQRGACTYNNCSHTTLKTVATTGTKWVNFVVHMGTFDLKIAKDGWSSKDENQTFIFRITGVDGFCMDVTIVGNGEVTIKNLPAGDYTVTELTEWSWRYTPTPTSQTIHSSDASAGIAQVSFTNGRNKKQWLSGDSYCENWWGGNGGKSVVRKDEE